MLAAKRVAVASTTVPSSVNDAVVLVEQYARTALGSSTSRAA